MPGMDLEGVGDFEAAADDTVERWGTPARERDVVNGVGHAAPVEFGAVIEPVDAEFLHFWVGGEEVFTKGPIVQDPQPYFRPAADQTRAAMASIAADADSLDDYIERVALYMHTEATARTPRDTGELQAGWHVE